LPVPFHCKTRQKADGDGIVHQLVLLGTIANPAYIIKILGIFVKQQKQKKAVVTSVRQ
jgi:hypothetical protein